MKPKKQCPALAFPTMERCVKKRGHEGPHVAIAKGVIATKKFVDRVSQQVIR